jgi:hypothetical protein
MKSIGKPCEGESHARIDEGRQGRPSGASAWENAEPVSYSTPRGLRDAPGTLRDVTGPPPVVQGPGLIYAPLHNARCPVQNGQRGPGVNGRFSPPQELVPPNNNAPLP